MVSKKHAETSEDTWRTRTGRQRQRPTPSAHALHRGHAERSTTIQVKGREVPEDDEAVGSELPMAKRRDYEPTRPLEDLHLQTGSGLLSVALTGGGFSKGCPTTNLAACDGPDSIVH